MILIEDQPTLTDLHGLINEVPTYPVTVRQLLDLASQKHSSRAVVDFYETFPEDEAFTDKDDLLSTTESVEMLRHQRARVEIIVPEED